MNHFFRHFFGTILLLSFFVIIFLAGCSEQSTGTAITKNGEQLTIEIAKTEEELRNGLMFRQNLDKNSGMLFVFQEPQILSFWMKNTLIPLDLLYLDASGKILEIITMPPCQKDVILCPSYISHDPSLFALELNAGKAKELNLQLGDQLILKLPK